MTSSALTESLTLNNGLKMPLLGLGTWNPSKPGEVANAVYLALKFGYRHIDGAHLYGNEQEVGEGLRKAMKEFGIKREEVFIVSKLWNNRMHPSDVEPTIKSTLADLGLDYIDLYLVHWPHARKSGKETHPMNEDGTPSFDLTINPTDTWLAMEKLVPKGYTKSIGISNFNRRQIQDILEKGSIIPVTNQVECTPYLNQDKLLDYCTKNKITLTAYSPLGSSHRPWAKPEDLKILEEPKLKKIAESHGKSVAQILIGWQIQRGVIVIPKSVSAKRIKENSNVFDFKLSDEDKNIINQLNMGNKGRIMFYPHEAHHPEYPFNDEF